ncbi:MAG: helix-turn-helix domain-containing protein [Corallococcus sp.]|nr:helix-turn-helix domain-containing protein [Corallococcus sp.]MCM1358932.1 helix-turn-helix domain-containing protein [Corallococcus sp.]MCM1394920.1 helix-turn-helix domain-containing protein [Corallococcus sp.]
MLEKFAERLSWLMFDKKLSSVELTSILGCGHTTINRYLKGNRLPKTEFVIRIADYFNCTTDYLLGLEEESYFCTFHKCPLFHKHFENVLNKCTMSPLSLHELTQIPLSAIYYWLDGTYLPTIDKIVQISETLNCSVDYLLGRTDN